MREPDSLRHDQLHRFDRLGLKWNPFRVVRPDEVEAVYVNDLYDGIEQATAVATGSVKFTQVIAPAGHGKSTFLRATATALFVQDVCFEWHYLPRTLFSRVPIPASEVSVLIIDEVERLSRSNLRKLIRWCDRDSGRLVMSTHNDLSSRFPSDVQTIELPGISAESLQRLFESRVRWAAGETARFSLSADAANWLVEVSRRNVRVIEAVLYEIFQRADDSEPLQITKVNLEPWREFAEERAATEAECRHSLMSRIALSFTEWSGKNSGLP